MLKFNKKDLFHRIKTFIGYGNLEAKFWFIGYEEGCSDNPDDVMYRLTVLGLQDIFEAHRRLKENVSHEKGINPLVWFEKRKYQTTWGALIKILLIAKGEFRKEIEEGKLSDSVLLERVKCYQSKLWGRTKGETLVAELLPLPSSQSVKWYEGYEKSEIEFLKSRESYKEHIVAKRIVFFQDLLKKYKPKVVVTYGKEFWEDFKKLISSKADRSPKENSFFEVYENIVLIEHPASVISNKNLIKIGCWIRDKILNE